MLGVSGREGKKLKREREKGKKRVGGMGSARKEGERERTQVRRRKIEAHQFPLLQLVSSHCRNLAVE